MFQKYDGSLSCFGVHFYKGTHSGFPGVYNRVVRWLDSGPYSHVELTFSDGMSASSSYMDRGVRFKQIIFDEDKWDFRPLPLKLESVAKNWFQTHLGRPYDLLGNIHFIDGFVRHDEDSFFCSEAIAAALGMPDAWRHTPNSLAGIVDWFWETA